MQAKSATSTGAAARAKRRALMDSTRTDGTVPSREVSRSAAHASILALTVAAGFLHAIIQSRRPLWLDEACTYWTIQAPAIEILQGVRTDGSPPLHFLLVQAVTTLFGTSEFAMRLVSMASATALVPACYAVVRRFASRPTALVAAALAVVSPLAHYYAVEARSYALVQLETAVILYTALRALAAPGKKRWWVALAVAQAVQLWTHGHAVFVVSVCPLVFLVAASNQRFASTAKAVAASAAASVLASPALLAGFRTQGIGVADWIEEFWRQTPPAAAVFRSLEVLGYGGRYPSYLASFGPLPDVRGLSVALTFLLMIAAVAPRGRRESRRSTEEASTKALMAFVVLPLVAAWGYSALWRPVYLVGRYDTSVFPAFLMVLAIGLDRVVHVRRWFAAPIWLVILGLSGASHASAAVNARFPGNEDRLAAEHLSRQGNDSDAVVATGFRRAVVAYYLDRAGRRLEMLSFPSEIAEHPGWYSSERLLADPERLDQDGRHVAAELIARAQQGGRIWIMTSGSNDVDPFLYRNLLTQLVLDRGRSREDLHVICLGAR